MTHPLNFEELYEYDAGQLESRCRSSCGSGRLKSI